ncbi:MAG: hypothetical protein P8J01_04450, partial [Acidimicrobiales bacterium]|nr:hypothetical protein [Acidimicrobiales bacterium]
HSELLEKRGVTFFCATTHGSGGSALREFVFYLLNKCLAARAARQADPKKVDLVKKHINTN